MVKNTKLGKVGKNWEEMGKKSRPPVYNIGVRTKAISQVLVAFLIRRTYATYTKKALQVSRVSRTYKRNILRKAQKGK